MKLSSKIKRHLRGSTQANPPLGKNTYRGPIGLGQYNSLGEYCVSYTNIGGPTQYCEMSTIVTNSCVSDPPSWSGDSSTSP